MANHSGSTWTYPYDREVDTAPGGEPFWFDVDSRVRVVGRDADAEGRREHWYYDELLRHDDAAVLLNEYERINQI